jgi:hypothetical protein
MTVACLLQTAIEAAGKEIVVCNAIKGGAITYNKQYPAIGTGSN